MATVVNATPTSRAVFMVISQPGRSVRRVGAEYRSGHVKKANPLGSPQLKAASAVGDTGSPLPTSRLWAMFLL